MNVLDLCSGIGGFALGLKLANHRARTVCYVEREAFCIEHLAQKMEAGALDAAPVWSDLAAFDGRPWRGVVDCIAAGFPCQPFSVAGKQRAEGDPRHLWPHIKRVVEECEPAAVFLENVNKRAFVEPYDDLRGLGFDCHPPFVATSQNYGAPHIRQRWFVLATHPERKGLEVGGSQPGDVGEELSAAKRGHRGATDTDAGRRESEWGGWVFDRERQTLRHDADRCGPGCRICGSPWATESPAVRVDDELPDRVDRLGAIGNGVDPLVVAHAWTTLKKRLIERDDE